MEISKSQNIIAHDRIVPYLRWKGGSVASAIVPTDLKTMDRATWKYSIRFMIEGGDPSAASRFHIANLGSGLGYYWIFIWSTTEHLKIGTEQVLVTENFGSQYLDGNLLGTNALMWMTNGYAYWLENRLCVGSEAIGYRVINGKVDTTGSGGMVSYQAMRVYEVKVEDYLTGELIRDYFPAEDQGIPGLRDTVTETFCPQYQMSGRQALEYGTEKRKGRMA